MSKVEIKKMPNWLIWRKEKRGGQLTKVPYSYLNTTASSVEPTSWTTFEKAMEAKDRYKATGVGFAFPLDKSIIGIDIDKCLDGDKVKDPKFEQLVKEANTYTEYSPSKTGLHLFFNVAEQGGFTFEKNRSKKCPGFECYSVGRYFTFTGESYGKEKPIRTVNRTELLGILAIVGYPWTESAVEKRINATVLDDHEVINRMFTSKNGDKIRRLYDGDISGYNNDPSSADMALCCHLAFWTQKNPEAIERLWLNSPLGSREKTAGRKDYRDRTIVNAIASVVEVYSPTDSANLVQTFNLMVDQKGKPYLNLVNVGRLIKGDPLLSTSIRFNAFSEEIETNLGTKYSDNKDWRPLVGGDEMFILHHLQETYPFFEKVPKAIIQDAVILYAYQHQVNDIQDWIKNLEWDGQHRLDHWLHYTYGTPDDEYHSAAGANWFKGLIKRVTEPGCKFDYMLVLEGIQGLGKSTSLTIIGRGYHAETVLEPNNKDFFMLLKRNIIVEFSEGYTMSRADSRMLKSIITMQEDNFRVPYEKYVGRFKRRCVFAMTTNEDQYLRDETGNRRYLPVRLERQADLEWLEANVEQLYAEAHKRAIEDRETYWEFPEEETKAKQESRMVDNPYAEPLIDWYAALSQSQRLLGVTALEAYQAVWLGGTPLGREMNVAHTMQVTGQFINILKLYKKKTMVGGKLANRWFPSGQTLDLIGEVEEDQPLLMGKDDF